MLKKLVTDKNFAKQLMLFVLLQPIIDITRTFFGNGIEILGISFQEIVNIVLCGYLCVIFFFKYHRDVKKLMIPISYTIILGVYLVFHIWNILQFNEEILNNCDINMFKEIYMIVRTYYVPGIVFIMMLLSPEINKKFDKIVTILSGGISGVIVITNILKVSFISYAGGLEKNAFIHKNIFEWFSNSNTEDAIYMTSKGWFYIGNQISIILFALFPILILLAFKYGKKYLALVLLQGIAMVMIGTKVASLGCILILGASSVIFVIFGVFLKQFEIRMKDIICWIGIIVTLIFLFFSSPFFEVQGAKQEAYVADEYETSLREKIKDMEKEVINSDSKEEESLDEKSIKDFAKEIEKNPYLYGINREFIELFPIEDNYEFWFKVATDETQAQLDYREFKKEIYQEVLKKNSNKWDKVLGIGYTSNFPYVEKDFYSQIVWFGYIGMGILMGPYILAITIAMMLLIRRLKINFRYGNMMFLMSILGSLLLCIMAGHLFNGIFSINIFGWIVASFYQVQRTGGIDIKQ